MNSDDPNTVKPPALDLSAALLIQQLRDELKLARQALERIAAVSDIGSFAAKHATKTLARLNGFTS